MWKYNHNDELYHYGVIGMKWGYRKARKKAQAENVKGRSKYSTGKNYDEFVKQDKINKQKFNEKMIKKYPDPSTYSKGFRQEVEEFNAKRNRDWNNAILKDLDPKYIKDGKKLLEKNFRFQYIDVYVPIDNDTFKIV